MTRKPLFIAVWLMSVFASLSAVAATGDQARQFVDNVGKRVLDIIDGNQGEEQKQQELRQMFADNVDMQWMAQFVVGRGWRDASAEQKARYIAAYKRYLLARYTSNFADYTGSKYTITGVTHDGDDQYTVDMQIKSDHGRMQETDAGYRVEAQGNGQFKIVDIIIEGVSLITTQRSDFGSVLQQRGMDGLIGELEAKADDERHAMLLPRPLAMMSALTSLIEPAMRSRPGAEHPGLAVLSMNILSENP